MESSTSAATSATYTLSIPEPGRCDGRYTTDRQVPRRSVADGTAYVGSSMGSFYAIDTTTGGEHVAFQWHTKSTVLPRSPMTPSSGAINKILAIDSGVGRTTIACEPREQDDRVPSVSGRIVSVGDDDGVLHALDVNTGGSLETYNSDLHCISSRHHRGSRVVRERSRLCVA